MRGIPALRREVVKTGKLLYKKGFIVATEGDISTRVSRFEFLITPTRVCKGELSPKMVLRAQIGEEPSLFGIASSEILMHSLVYQKREDVGGIIHAYPPFLTGFALSGKAIKKSLWGEVGVVEYRKPGSEELATRVSEKIIHCDQLILTNYGVLIVGKDLKEAVQKIERLELLAQTVVVSKILRL